MIVVEALKNICGLSIIEGMIIMVSCMRIEVTFNKIGLNDLYEFNLRKFQLKVQEPLVEPPPELP